MMMYYRLGSDGKTPERCDALGLDEDGKDPDRIGPRPGASWAAVAKTKIGDVGVSTVFLGINHNFGPRGPAILFETMVFGGRLDREQERCSTWERAEAQHAAMVARVRGGVA